MKELEIGDTLNAYQDGKLGRKTIVAVDDIIPRRSLSPSARKMWKKAVNEDLGECFDTCVCHVWEENRQWKWAYQFWDWNCDTFISGHIVGHMKGEREMKPNTMLFARRICGDWYCINLNYLLDVGKRTVVSPIMVPADGLH